MIPVSITTDPIFLAYRNGSMEVESISLQKLANKIWRFSKRISNKSVAFSSKEQELMIYFCHQLSEKSQELNIEETTVKLAISNIAFSKAEILEEDNKDVDVMEISEEQSSTGNQIIRILRFVVPAVLVIGLFIDNYESESYFVFLKWIVSCASLYISILELRKKSMNWSGLFFVIAVLYNPIFTPFLERSHWLALDAAVILLFIFKNDWHVQHAKGL